MTRRAVEDALPLKPKTFLILLVLGEDGPLHGYAIRKGMEARSAGAVSMDAGGLYRLLARLEREGLVEYIAQPAEETDERRQYLRITPWGRTVLAAEAGRIAALARMPSVRALAREGK